MPKHFILNLVCWLGISSLSLVAADDAVTVSSMAKGKTYSATVTREHLASTPQWDGNGALPLSPGAARGKAQKVFQTIVPNSSDYTVTSISLQNSENHWYYQITFFDLKHPIDVSHISTPFSIIVLLNGTVVPSHLEADK
jgi:hypothetical protein